jgi:hypothetical protein
MIRALVPLASLASLAATLLLGCSAPDGPLPVQAPLASPRPGVVVWQQFCEQAWNVAHASSLAAARGAEGWELVAMYNGVLCFKRPAGEPPPVARAPSSPSGVQSTVPIVRDPGF